MFSHFDGIIGDLFNGLKRRDPRFGEAAELNSRFCSIKKKAAAIAEWVAKNERVVLPTIADDLKLLRDILNHPSITKESVGPGATETMVYDAADVHGLDIAEVDMSARQIGLWLDAAWRACKHQRFCDTEKLAKEFARALGGQPSSVREI